MPWVKIDDQFPEHGDGAAIGVLGRGLLTDMLCYANRNLTDGFVPDAVMDRLLAERDYQGNGAAVLERLQAKPVELVRRVDRGLGSGWTILHYHRYQPSKREVERERAERHARKSEAGKIGASKRWQRDDKLNSRPGGSADRRPDDRADGKTEGKRVAERTAHRPASVQQAVKQPAWQTDGPVPVPEDQDQDPGLPAGPPPCGNVENQDLRPRVVRARPPDPASVRVLTQVAADLIRLRPADDRTLADLYADVKQRCATLGLAYDAESVRKAVDGAEALTRRHAGRARQEA